MILPYDDELIVNDVRMSREGASSRSRLAVVRRTPRSWVAQEAGFQTTGIQLSSDIQVADLAEHTLTRFSEPQLRFEQLTDNAMRHQFWERVLGREINDSINVIESRTETAQVSSIEGIGHNIARKEWWVTFTVSPTTIVQAGIWDDPVYGLWDSTVHLGEVGANGIYRSSNTVRGPDCFGHRLGECGQSEFHVDGAASHRSQTERRHCGDQYDVRCRCSLSFAAWCQRSVAFRVQPVSCEQLRRPENPSVVDRHGQFHWRESRESERAS